MLAPGVTTHLGPERLPRFSWKLISSDPVGSMPALNSSGCHDPGYSYTISPSGKATVLAFLIILYFSSRKIKMRIVIAKELFNRKISLWTSKLNIELGKKLLYMLRDLVTKLFGHETIWSALKYGAGGEWRR